MVPNAATAEEELEEVSGRQLLQGPPEEEAAPLPQVLVQVRRTIEEATSTAEAAFRLEWAALESERQRLGDWHSRLEGRIKAEASHAARVWSELKADQESYRANLRKVFDRELAVAGREKALERREAAIAEAEAGLMLQETASKQAVAELELEEDRKSLAKRESLTTNMELQLERQREALKSLKESAAKKAAQLEERTRQVEAAKAALDARVQEAVQKLQEDQLRGAQWIVDWANEASLALTLAPRADPCWPA
ncbi:uncharacterized protein LOC120678201 [Panicum virgatum]|uniref:uncharacterized protein LOC120678201 n=1 Tax=Panicum virgatum TaxID=38727 RepID=UPI0019D5F519|nr:uncharacterized protein LOC120678201 [Panicum virgatum]